MATIAELSAKVDELQGVVDTEQEQIAAAVATLNQTIIDLQAIIDAGGDPTAIQAIIDKVDVVITDLKATIPDEPPV